MSVTHHNFVSLRQQLEQVDRVVDLAGVPLYLTYLFDNVHHLARHRGLPAGAVVDVILNAARKAELWEVMGSYYDDKYGAPGSALRFVEIRPDQPFPCTIYDLPEIGYRMAAITLPDYDGEDLCLLDWSDISFIPRGGMASVAADNPERHLIIINAGTLCSDPP